MFGWVRNNYHQQIPQELTKVIESFSYHVIPFMYDGEKFQEMNKKRFSLDPIKMKIDGFDFSLSVSNIHQIWMTSWNFDLEIDESSLAAKDILYLKVRIIFSGNIRQKQNLELIYKKGLPLGAKRKIANNEIIGTDNKIDILFQISIRFVYRVVIDRINHKSVDSICP